MSSNRHPFAVLSAAASLITVLGFFGVHQWRSSPAAPTGYSGPIPTSNPPTPAAQVSPSPPNGSATTATSVVCTIEDRLGEGQVAESAQVTFARTWSLSIDQSSPRDRVRLRFPRAGTYHYSVTVRTETADGHILRGEGDGTIDCRGAQTFVLSGDYSTNPVDVTLVEL